MGGEHPRRAAGADQRGVEHLVQRVELAHAFRKSARIEATVMAKPVQCRHDPPSHSPPPSAMLTAERLALDDGPDAHDVGEVLSRHRSDAESPFADGLDEASRGKPRQRLAQRRRAHSIARRRLGDAEPRPRREGAANDVGLDERGGSFGQRLGGRRGVVHGRTSASRSMDDCSMSCCLIVSTHQANSAPLSSGSRDAGPVEAHDVDRHLGELGDGR